MMICIIVGAPRDMEVPFASPAREYEFMNISRLMDHGQMLFAPHSLIESESE